MKIFNELLNAISLDRRSLGIFRILLGIFTIWQGFARLSDVKIFLSGEGVLPRVDLCSTSNCYNVYELTNVEGSFSLNLINDSVFFQTLLLVVLILLGINLILGYKSRFTLLMIWILTVSMQNLNPAVLQGGDVVIRMTMFFAIFLPIGDRFSIDSLRAKSIEPNRIGNVATAAYILQIVFIYFFAALLKDADEWKVDYTATYYALSLEQFNSWIGREMLNHPHLLKALTFFVWYLELLVGFLLILPLKNWIFRTAGVFLLIGMHIGFGTTLALGPFPIISIISFIALLPTELWDNLGRLITRKRIKQDLVVKYNPEDRRQVLNINSLINLNLMLRTEFKEEKGLKKMSFNKDGKSIDSSELKKHKIFNFDEVSSKFYMFISRLTPVNLGYTDIKYFTVNFVPAIVIMLVFLWNLSSQTGAVKLNQEFKDAIIVFRFDQYWNMFAPFPLKESGWFVIDGKGMNGEDIHILGAKNSSIGNKPENISGTFKNQRWRKFLMNLRNDDHKAYRYNLSDYFCREYRENPDLQDLRNVRIMFFSEITNENPDEEIIKRITLINYDCLNKKEL